MNSKQHGFTLIELLVAMAITVVIAAIAYRFLDSALNASARSDNLLREVNVLENFWQVLASDLQYTSSRELPQAELADHSSPAFSGGASETPFANDLPGTLLLHLFREGWSNPLQQQRSELQGVAYRWHDGNVLRDYWPERNQPQLYARPRQQVLLDDVRDFQIRFLPPDPVGSADLDAYWLHSWPPPAQLGNGETMAPANLPAALEITLKLEDLGDVRRVFTLPGS